MLGPGSEPQKAYQRIEMVSLWMVISRLFPTYKVLDDRRAQLACVLVSLLMFR